MTGVADPLLPCGPNAHEPVPTYPDLEKRFRIIEKMGDGAFSSVYKSVDTTTGQLVAIKVVRKFELNTMQRASVMKEVNIMRTIRHPNIISLHSFAESKDYYYLILELMSGGELFHQIVRLTYFSEDLSRHVILQVAHGIRYLHEERGVVHRDIKPENLLFEPIPFLYEEGKAPKTHIVIADDIEEEKEEEGIFLTGVGGGGIGKVKIADFGLSKVVWNEKTMTPCGTVGYTAPEIVRDERYSKSVDMWALGCVLYTLLCGFPPFYDDSVRVLTEKVAKGQYTFLSPWWDGISYSAKDLISHLLTVDPKERYTIDEFLSHPWCLQNQNPPQSNYPVLRSIDGKHAIDHYNFPFLVADAEAQHAENAVREKQKVPQLADKSFPLPPSGRDRIPGHVQLPIGYGWDTFRAAHAGATFTPLLTPGNLLSRRTRAPVTPGPMTPGGATMKEVIDVSYAVQRAEEEEALRRRHQAAVRARVVSSGKPGAIAAGKVRTVQTPALRQHQQHTNGKLGLCPACQPNEMSPERGAHGVVRGIEDTDLEKERSADDLRRAIREAVASKLDLMGANSVESSSNGNGDEADASRHGHPRPADLNGCVVVPPPEEVGVVGVKGVQAREVEVNIESPADISRAGFDLRLEKATLLGRRRKGSSPQGSPPLSPTNSDLFDLSSRAK